MFQPAGQPGALCLFVRRVPARVNSFSCNLLHVLAAELVLRNILPESPRLPLTCFGLFLLVLCVIPVNAADPIEGEAFCQGQVSQITFAGNHKTRDKVMLEQLQIAPGEPCSLDPIIDGVQSIMDLGLFRNVVASLSQNNNALVLNYRVREKIFFFPLPRFSRTSDGELRLGAQLRWDNFRGLNHQLKITGERREEDDGRGAAGEHYELEYLIPRFLGSDFGFATELQHRLQERELMQDRRQYGTAESTDNLLKLQLSKWVNQGGVTEGFRYRMGFRLHHRSLNLSSGDYGPFTEGLDVAVNAGFERRAVRDDLFRLRGSVYGLNFQLSSGSFGSDFSYNRTDLYYRRYMPLPGMNLKNLNYQLRLGVSNAGPFGEHLYTLGGGERLRGMRPDYKTGDILILANIEYLVALPRNQALRGVLFTDIGNVYDHNDFNPLKQRLGLGAGLRWKLLSFSNTDIRLDAAYDSRENSLRYYFSTSLTF